MLVHFRNIYARTAKSTLGQKSSICARSTDKEQPKQTENDDQSSSGQPMIECTPIMVVQGLCPGRPGPLWGKQGAIAYIVSVISPRLGKRLWSCYSML